MPIHNWYLRKSTPKLVSTRIEEAILCRTNCLFSFNIETAIFVLLLLINNSLKKCSDTCQHKTKFVLTLIKTDLTLVEIYAVPLDFFGLDTYVRLKCKLYRSAPKALGKFKISVYNYAIVVVLESRISRYCC